MHGSTGAGALRHAAAGAPIVLTIATVDALVVGATAFSTSVNYRSASLRGVATRVTGDEQVALLGALTEAFLPGRMGEVPGLTHKQLAATMVLALPITADNWIMKVRAMGPDEMVVDADGGGAGGWGGIVPVRTVLDEA
ncbi:pyridoxamine 5'-phosphate oxidase family protein, partial [Propionibacterium freudenreichii]|nr:pyridoxamine 5'-phosphate oxidase family protein [Propionibacterium freudenreichii]